MQIAKNLLSQEIKKRMSWLLGSCMKCRQKITIWPVFPMCCFGILLFNKYCFILVIINAKYKAAGK